MNALSFISGAVTMGFALSALFFLRFWRATKDGLFLWFAVAFLLLGVGQAVLAFGQTGVEDSSWIYLIRLVSFGLICTAVLRKNLQER